MVNADHLRDANPWQPMSAAIDLKHLGKLAEELGEAAAAISRCIIQGVDEVEPVTGKSNRLWLEDELADVSANMVLVIQHFGLDIVRMDQRKLKKEAFLRRWHSHTPAAPDLAPLPFSARCGALDSNGMTLRDWFAGQALIGLITHAQDANHDGWSYRTGTLAGDAYAFADDMMIARKASHDQ